MKVAFDYFLKNARPNANQILFLLTDGTPNDRDSYYNTYIDNIKKNGILMLVIGVD